MVRIEADRVTFTYRNGHTAVREQSLTLEPGTLSVITGDTGSGKSTLLRCLCGLVPHLYKGQLAGRILIDGHDIRRSSTWEISRRVGTILQNPDQQFVTSRVADELAFSAELASLPGEQKLRRSAEMMERFELGPLADRAPWELSGGEQQRVLFACTMVRRPQALLLDEPFSMLDRDRTAWLAEELPAQARDGGTVAVFEHVDHPLPEPMRRTHQLPHRPRDIGMTPDALAIPPADSGTVTLRGLSVPPARLKGVDLSMSGGELVLLTGANGSGKTTLLRCLAGLQKYAGELTWSNRSVARPSCVLVVQNPAMQLFCGTVMEELMYGRGEKDRSRANRILDATGLGGNGNRVPLSLSMGEQRLLSLAIAFMARPSCAFLFDEPVIGQDPATKRAIAALLAQLVRKGYLCVVATHEREWIVPVATREIRLAAGRLVSDAAPSFGEAA